MPTARKSTTSKRGSHPESKARRSAAGKSRSKAGRKWSQRVTESSNALDLRKPIYSPTSAYGHFGRSPKKNGKGTLFTWERLDRVADLRKAVDAR